MLLLNNILKIIILIIGDLFSFLFGFLTALIIRYRFSFDKIIFLNGLWYFIPVFFIWILIFFIFRLYELIYLTNRKEFFERLFKISLFNIIGAIIYFYIFSSSHYRPSLVLVLTVFFSLFYVIIWRIFANKILRFRKIKIIFETNNARAEELKQIILSNPQLGYEISEKIVEGAKNIIIQDLISDISYDRNISYLSLEEFYELICHKVPLDLINDYWFHQILTHHNYFYETLKRIADIIFGILLLVISLPIWPIIAFLIKIDSPGEVIYRSVRIGRNRKPFYIYKFRTMVKNANKIGPAWTLENDPRITKVGKILRKTHLDEVPQVLNIIKGDISFVGPRPEEETLVNLYEKEIPFYRYRHLIKPGVIGWAQINYPQSSSLEDARHKLEYDFYYFKTRNLFFDFIIALKAWRIPFEIPTH
ncbi:MAG: sugar transferase [Minisyncoccia bacterium]